METKIWHHRKQDRGAVLSGPNGPLCAIRAQSRHRRPAIPVRSVQSVHFARKTYGNKDLAPPQLDRGAVLSGPIGPLCAILAPRPDERTLRRRVMPGLLGHLRSERYGK